MAAPLRHVARAVAAQHEAVVGAPWGHGEREAPKRLPLSGEEQPHSPPVPAKGWWRVKGVHTHVETGTRRGQWSRAVVVPSRHPAEPTTRGGLRTVPTAPTSARASRPPRLPRDGTVHCPGKCQSSQTVESFVPKIICANSRPDYFFFIIKFFFFLFP